MCVYIFSIDPGYEKERRFFMLSRDPNLPTGRCMIQVRDPFFLRIEYNTYISICLYTQVLRRGA